MKISKNIRNLQKFILIIILIGSFSFAFLGLNNSNDYQKKEKLPNVQAPLVGYNQLQTIHALEDTNPGGWAGDGIGALETENSMFPLDWTETYEGLPSFRVNVMQPTDWWTSMIVLAGWVTVDLTAYILSGTLEFNVKGDIGGEAFSIGFKDSVEERTVGSIDSFVPCANYVQLTTEWQHVSIPLSDIFNTGSEINSKQIQCIGIGPSIYPITANKFWINNIEIKSPDKEISYPEIKVNQLGYVSNVEKYALISGFIEDLTADVGTTFEVRNVIDDSLAYSGTLTLVTEYDEIVSGEKVLRADFSSVNIPGSYYISVLATGIENSPVFEIGDTIYDDLLIDASRYFYYQRANEELVEPYAEGFPHTSFHPQDFNAPLESGYNGITKDVSSGWYDAGDCGKYVNTGAASIQDLLWAYEFFPTQFPDNHLNIPESGNGIPDLLDEIKIELEFLLNMQDEISGGFYHRVQSIGADTPDAQREIKDIGDDGSTNVMPTPSSADTVAALARASTIYIPYDSDFANELLAASELGWTYLVNNPNYIAIPTGPYTDSDDGNDRLLAAACLYGATGDLSYNNYFLSSYDQFGTNLDTPERGHYTEFLAFFAYLNAENPDQTFINWFSPKFSSWRTAQIDRINSVAWHNSLEPWQYWWGSSAMALNTPIDIYIGSKLLGDYQPSHSEAVRANINYIMGINPLQMCYVTGYGTRNPEAIFSSIYSNDGKPGLPKGIVPLGPNMYEGKLLSKFSGKCYSDVNTDWTSNEHAIPMASHFLFDVALIAFEASGDNDTPILTQPEDFTYKEGEIGNVITWTATDDNPDTYIITLDAIEVGSGSWTSGVEISISIDGLTAGTHEYIITVSDADGLSASDCVSVTVTDGSAGTVWMLDIDDQGVGSVFSSSFLADTGTQSLAAFGFYITFDPTLLEINSITTNIAGMTLIPNLDNDSGTLTIAGFSTSAADPSDKLEVIQIEWTALAEGTSPITTTVNDLADDSTNVIGILNGIDNSITIIPPYPLGDVNRDGSVTIVDALLVAQFYVGVPVDIDETLADVNLDGLVTIVDALIIAQYYVGQISELPYT